MPHISMSSTIRAGLDLTTPVGPPKNHSAARPFDLHHKHRWWSLREPTESPLSKLRSRPQRAVHYSLPQAHDTVDSLSIVLHTPLSNTAKPHHTVHRAQATHTFTAERLKHTVKTFVREYSQLRDLDVVACAHQDAACPIFSPPRVVYHSVVAVGHCGVRAHKHQVRCDRGLLRRPSQQTSGGILLRSTQATTATKFDHPRLPCTVMSRNMTVVVRDCAGLRNIGSNLT